MRSTSRRHTYPLIILIALTAVVLGGTALAGVHPQRIKAIPKGISADSVLRTIGKPSRVQSVHRLYYKSHQVAVDAVTSAVSVPVAAASAVDTRTGTEDEADVLIAFDSRRPTGLVMIIR